MKIEVKDALKKFFPNPSFDLIYTEAVANALDAEASEISIEINLDEFQDSDTLTICITDNGVGFTDARYKKFSTLLQTDDSRHKGLGRLVFLNYFKKVEIESVFDSNRRSVFVYDDNFNGEARDVETIAPCKSYSRLFFSSFRNKKLHKKDNINPTAIKKYLTDVFLPRFYALRKDGKQLEISIQTKSKDDSPSETLTLDTLPVFEEYSISDTGLDLFNNSARLLYRIETMSTAPSSVCICVDGRAYPLDALKGVKFPVGVSATFILESPFFDSKVDDSRTEVKFDSSEVSAIEDILFCSIANVVGKEIPGLSERNEETRQSLSLKYPHLVGFFDLNSIGLVDENESLERAQRAFSKAQKEVLGAKKVTDELYEKALDQASRVLMQYILYRNITLDKLEQFDHKNQESDIHNLIVPMQKTFESKDMLRDLYTNNAWILDDKFMSYQCVLSDEYIDKLIKRVFEDCERPPNDVRPDIAFVFSSDPEKTEHPFDVVVVELKRKGLGYLDNRTIVEQLRQRARRLAGYYPDRIQRIWYFGIVEFDAETLGSLDEEEWMPLYSRGQVYYKEQSVIAVDADNKRIGNKKYPAPTTLLSFDALCKDARDRNETFMKILKDSIQMSLRDNPKP